MRIVFAGTPEAAVPSLKALNDAGHSIEAVLTRPDARVGRGRTLAPSPVKAAAAELGIPAIETTTLRDEQVIAQLAAIAPECIPVVAFGVIVPPNALELPQHGWINLHFSLLPAWRGAAPVQHAIWHGDAITGATTFHIVSELDAGPAFGFVTESIQPSDTTGTLLTRLSHSGAQLLAGTLDAVGTGDASAVAQSATEISFAPKITGEDAAVNWAHPALAVDRHIRAMTPAPGAWTELSSGAEAVRIKLGPVTVVDDIGSIEPGRIEVSKSDVIVGTASSPVKLGMLAPPGKRDMPAADWARGARLSDDAHFIVK